MPFQKKALRDRLSAVEFIDGLPNNAITFPAPKQGSRLRYEIAIRAGVLDETISDLLQRKESACYDGTGGYAVKVKAGSLDAIAYVLLHEATHVATVDKRLLDDRSRALVRAAERGIWRDDLAPGTPFSPALCQSCFRLHGQPSPGSEAPAVYRALSRTPFVSLYATANRSEDIAELSAWYQLHCRFGQDYSVQTTRAGRTIVDFRPFDEPLVQARLARFGRRLHEVGG